MNKNITLTGNVLLNIINRIGSILFQIVTFPYISRVLQTENYGKVIYCSSIMNYFLLLASLGISSYAIREGVKIREDLRTLKIFLNDIFTINLISTIISTIFYFILIFSINELHKNNILLCVFGIQIILNIFNIDWINNIFEDFLFITIRNLVVHTISLLMLLNFVTSRQDYIIYAIILSISSGSAGVYSFLRTKRKIGICITKDPHVKKHLKSIIILFFNELAITIYVNSDIMILGILQTKHVVGVYSSAVKIYTVVKIIFQAIVAVTLPRMSFYVNDKSTKKYILLLNKEIKIVLTITFPMLVGLFMMAENAILIASGEKYLEAVLALKILCVALVFSALAAVLTTSVLLPMKKEKYILVSTSISSISNVILNMILIPIFSLNGAALTTVFAELIVVVISLFHARGYKIVSTIFSISGKAIIGCIAIILVCFFISNLKLGLLMDSVIKIFFSAFIYLIIQIILKNDVVISVINNLIPEWISN